MGIFERCDSHGFTKPCPVCIAEEGWVMHGGKLPIPPTVLSAVVKQMSPTVAPIKYEPPVAPEVVWSDTPHGAMEVVLPLGFRLEVREDWEHSEKSVQGTWSWSCYSRDDVELSGGEAIGPDGAKQAAVAYFGSQVAGLYMSVNSLK